jgi:hypothetical protein
VKRDYGCDSLFSCYFFLSMSIALCGDEVRNGLRGLSVRNGWSIEGIVCVEPGRVWLVSRCIGLDEWVTVVIHR